MASVLVVSGIVHLALIAAILPGTLLTIGSENQVPNANLVAKLRASSRAIGSDAATTALSGSVFGPAAATPFGPAAGAGAALHGGGGATSVPVLDDYLPTSLLTRPPSPIDSIDPTPPAFQYEGVVGEIELMLLISSDGDVDDVLLIGASLPMPFVEYAKAVFREARFTPGMVNATPVRSRVRIVLGPASDTAMTDATISTSMKNRR